nr:MAG TPA: hypothetical protein [Caudoviricetes sp.]
MSVLSWGKPRIQKCASVAGVPDGNWVDLDTPKQDTTKLTTTAGQEVTANEEGGDVVDVRAGKNTYSLEFDQFVKKGVARDFEDEDGLVAGEFAIRLIPEDEATEGLLIERATIRVEENYSATDGKIRHVVVKAIKPAAGKTLKPYTHNGLVVSLRELFFTSAADTTGKSITVTSTANPSTTSSERWATAETAGKTVKVKVEGNTTGKPRKAVVTITADGKSAIIEVTQIPA